MRSELPAAEIRAVEALPLFRPAHEHLLELPDIVFGTGLGRHLEKGVDDIGHIAQEQSGPLLPLVLDEQAVARAGT